MNCPEPSRRGQLLLRRARSHPCRSAVLTALLIALAVISAPLLRYAYIRVAYGSVLHTFLAGGRLGNRVFQNLAVSALARQFDVAALYDMAPEFAELGIPLASGVRALSGEVVDLGSDELQRLLTSSAATLPYRPLVQHPLGYFQTPWMARHVRFDALPPLRASILAANPWRDRVGRNTDVCVHVRLGHARGDISDEVLPAYFFPSLLAAATAAALTAPRRRILIASDDPAHSGVRGLVAQLGAEELPPGLSPVQTVQFMAACDRLVLSDGTFSWLMGVLASTLNASSIRYVPRDFVWHGDIFVFDDWQKVIVE